MGAALYRRDFLIHADKHRFLIEPVSIPRLRDPRSYRKLGPFHENKTPDLKRGYRERIVWDRNGEEIVKQKLGQFTTTRLRHHVWTHEDYAEKKWFCSRYEQVIPFICFEFDRHDYEEKSEAEILRHEAFLEEQRDAIDQCAAALGTRPVWTHSPGDEVRRPFSDQTEHIRGEYAWIRFSKPLPRKEAEILVRWMRFEFDITVECPVIDGFVRLPGQAWCEPLRSKAGASSRQAFADFCDAWMKAVPVDQHAVEAALEAAPDSLPKEAHVGFAGTTYGYDLSAAPDSFDVLKTICSRTVQRYQYDGERLGEMLAEAKQIFMDHRPGSSIAGAELDRKAGYVLTHFLSQGPNGHYQPFVFDDDTAKYLARVRNLREDELEALQTFIRMQNNPNLGFLAHSVIYKALGKRRYLRMRKKLSDLFQIIEQERHFAITNAINGEVRKGRCRRYADVRKVLLEKVKDWVARTKESIKQYLGKLRKKWQGLETLPLSSPAITTIRTPQSTDDAPPQLATINHSSHGTNRQRPPPDRRWIPPWWMLPSLE